MQKPTMETCTTKLLLEAGVDSEELNHDFSNPES